MKHPKKCDGCKAFWQSTWKFNCDLGYELETIIVSKYMGEDIKSVRPKCGECPKPLTNEQLIEACSERGRRCSEK